MTNEEALQILSERDRIGVNIINANDAETTKYNNDSIEALSMAIEALKAEPCEDAVSREFMYKLGAKCIAVRTENGELIAITSIESLPSVTPKPTECEDAVSRQAMLDGLTSIAKAKAKSDAQKSLMGRVMFFTEQLPPVAPKQRWIPVSDRLPKTHGVYNVTRRIDGADIADSCFYDGQGTWYDDTRINHERKYLHDITAWMPLPKPYKEGVSE